MTRATPLLLVAGLLLAPGVAAAPALPVELALTFCWDYPSCGESRLVVLEDGRFADLYSGDGGDWTWDATFRELTLAFDVGTTYRGRPYGPDCLQGRMVSFYGDEGVWRACAD